MFNFLGFNKSQKQVENISKAQAGDTGLIYHDINEYLRALGIVTTALNKQKLIHQSEIAKLEAEIVDLKRQLLAKPRIVYKQR